MGQNYYTPIFPLPISNEHLRKSNQIFQPLGQCPYIDGLIFTPVTSHISHFNFRSVLWFNFQE